MRIGLRPPHPTDIKVHATFPVSPEIMHMYGGDPTQLPKPSLARSKGWFEHLSKQDRVWMIEVDRKLAGVIFLHSVSKRDQSARLAMGLFDEAQLGRGIGRHALRLALAEAFSAESGLHRIELKVLAYNTRAIRCYEAVGFQHEGRLRHSARVAGKWEDDLIMSILAPEFTDNPEG